MEFLSRLEQASPLIECLPATCILHESVPLAELDLNVVRKENIVSLRRTVHFNFRSSAVFRHHIANAGENSRVAVDGFTVWFDVASRGLVLSTSPYAAPTHWKQTTILLPLEVRSAESVAFSVDDEELSVDMHICASDDTLRSYTLELELM
ncbi:unnamed protein product [Trypanosoma congolense IL3000]|uniref:WGS project CAEQ00000000 data, annotated contig 939 n=1 Tax=Trypanosoma congolense (strain IL3000) TaxID=1068625 RepID=F9WJR3_TRYCI|nr:unnamed protein product [Trypanosoma congolense IL3000]